MRLYIYRGLKNEKVPKDVTHVIVDNSVTVIKRRAFSSCYHLVSLTMGDSVKRIEKEAFSRCIALRFIRLSKTLEYIGLYAFWDCDSLEALFLPSSSHRHSTRLDRAFSQCRRLRLLILPNEIDLSNVGNGDVIINNTDINQIAEAAGVV